MKITPIPALIVLGVGVIAASQSVFTVGETQQALVLQLGQPRGEPRDPGIHFKIPFIQEVRYFDARVLSIDPQAEPVVISSVNVRKLLQRKLRNSLPKRLMKKLKKPHKSILDQISKMSAGEPIIVDTFARYKITDPLQFMKTLRTIPNANSRIESILNGSTRAGTRGNNPWRDPFRRTHRDYGQDSRAQ